MVSGDLALAMAVCHYLPQLSLDRAIPHHVLQRRGAISFSSSSSLFKSLPRLEVSVDKTRHCFDFFLYRKDIGNLPLTLFSVHVAILGQHVVVLLYRSI